MNCKRSRFAVNGKGCDCMLGHVLIPFGNIYVTKREAQFDSEIIYIEVESHNL